MKKKNNNLRLSDVKEIAKEYSLPLINGTLILEAMYRLNRSASEKDFRRLAKICSDINQTPSLNNPKTKADMAKRKKLIGKYSVYFDFAYSILQEVKDKTVSNNDNKLATSIDDNTER